MAKQRPVVVSEQEEGISVVLINVRGSGDTVRQSLNALSQALVGFTGQVVATKQIGNGKRTPAALPNPTDTVDGDTLDATPDDERGDVIEQPAAAPAAKRQPPKPPKPDSTLNVVPFKTFVGERNPKTMDEKYLLACLWLQEDSGRPTYGGTQILTCFRTMGWTEYGDFTQPLRTMKRDTTYFDQTVPKKQWKLTENGLDVARKIKHPATS